MQKNYDETLVLPKAYSAMNEDEMMYLEGGGEIAYNAGMCNKAFCLAYATAYRAVNQYSNIGILDLAAEIFTHAYAYYKGGVLLQILAKAGIGKASQFANSIVDGIFVEDGLDSRTIAGIEYYKVYRTVYALAQ